MEKPLYQVSLERVHARFMAANEAEREKMLSEMLAQSESAENDEQQKRFWTELRNWLISQGDKKEVSH